MSATLAASCGSVGNVRVSQHQGCSCQDFRSRVMVMRDTFRGCLASSRGDRWVTAPKLLGWGRECGGEDLVLALLGELWRS